MGRFIVFNLELQEGLEESYYTCLDADPFDEVCDHLMVQDMNSNEVVGTYRLQPGPRAQARRGYYSAQEFDLAPFEPMRSEVIELGRACVSKQHRNLMVLKLLWKGIAAYANNHGGRYLLGCSSINSVDPRVGAALYANLSATHLASPELRTFPVPTMACPLDDRAQTVPELPKLLAAYLSLGAKIAGPPALDREFKTIDFLTVLDLSNLPPRASKRFLE